MTNTIVASAKIPNGKQEIVWNLETLLNMRATWLTGLFGTVREDKVPFLQVQFTQVNPTTPVIFTVAEIFRPSVVSRVMVIGL
jgi:hypothetical protein